ncbi:MAG: hypothetical protein ACHQX1_00995 [Candidatus Micrarchaeales archaeon]
MSGTEAIRTSPVGTETTVKFRISSNDRAAFARRFQMLKAPLKEWPAEQTDYKFVGWEGFPDTLVELKSPMASLINELRESFEISVTTYEQLQSAIDRIGSARGLQRPERDIDDQPK